jgi:hypothetical protein
MPAGDRVFGEVCPWDGLVCGCEGACALDERLREVAVGRINEALDAEARELEEAVTA